MPFAPSLFLFLFSAGPFSKEFQEKAHSKIFGGKNLLKRRKLEERKVLKILPHDYQVQSPIHETRRQSYDFRIYNYNASTVEGSSVFQCRRKYFCFQNALDYVFVAL
jgi:hypothetical protein